MSSVFCLFTRWKIQIAGCGEEMIVLWFGANLVCHQVAVQDDEERKTVAVPQLSNHQHYNSGSLFYLEQPLNQNRLWALK